MALKFKKKEFDSVSDLLEYKNQKYKVLIVDDETEVHTITKGVLRNFDFNGIGLDLISAYSGTEALDMLRINTDVALILLDVVMETDDAGLKTAKAIREDLKNSLVRIVLRTGQPGSAPETDVIKNYDINDYKEKTELTTQKLYTTVISSLRSYKDLITIHQNRLGLEKILESSKNLLTMQSAKLFSDGVLTQVLSILKLTSPTKTQINGAFSVHKIDGYYKIVSRIGEYEEIEAESILTPDMISILDNVCKEGKNSVINHAFVGYTKTSNNTECLIYIDDCTEINQLDIKMLDLFMTNSAVMYDNLLLNSDIIDAQKEMIERLGEVVESRSSDTAKHVNRVAEISYRLAKAYGLDENVAQLIKIASPMHDIGKVSTPDAILLKPGKLDESEFNIMKHHTVAGHEILSKSNREILKTASIIAHEHHEKWDGTGYPRGLSGEQIHLYARITAIADVFDALNQPRAYKEPWCTDDIKKFIKDNSGKHFDPSIVNIFFENIDEIIAID